MQSHLPTGHPYFASAQPLLMDMAIHHFGLMRVVLGREPVSVTCESWNPPWNAFADPAVAAATVRFEGGAVVSYRGSWLSGPPTNWAGAWRRECEGGTLTWTSRNGRDLGGERVTVRVGDRPARALELPTMRYTGRRGSLYAFLGAIQNGQEPPCSGRDNLGTVALMEAAVASAEAAPTTRPVEASTGV